MAGDGEDRILVGGAKAQSRKPRRDGWTEAKRNRFLADLALNCNVAAAVRTVGMSVQGAYRLRRRSARFRADWAQAVNEGHERLRLLMLERAINGTVREIRRPGGVIERIVEYPDHIALKLLSAHRDTAAAAAPGLPDEEIDAVRKRIMRKLAVVRKRIEAGEE